MSNTQTKSMILVKMSMLVAISVVLAWLIHPSILPMVPFLEYDPADIPILIGGFAFGPAAGIALTVVTSVLQGLTVSAQSGIYGIIMHVLATSSLVLVAGLIYKANKTRKNAAIGLIMGTVAMIAVMAGANLVVTPYFMGAPVNAIIPMLPYIVLFNLIKAGINSLITFVLYKRISGFLHK